MKEISRRASSALTFPHALIGLWLLLLLSAAGLAADLKCPVCGMKFKPTAKTRFEATFEGKELNLCSFSCARRFRKKHSEAPLFAHDFLTDKKVSAGSAYFLAKSQNVLKELDFDMPPSVVAFTEETQAEKNARP